VVNYNLGGSKLKISNGRVVEDDGVVLDGESNIRDSHWNKILEKDTNIKSKLKIKEIKDEKGHTGEGKLSN